MEDHGEEGEADRERSDDEDETFSEDSKHNENEDEDDEDVGVGAKDDERRLLDELEGLEEAEEEEYSGPLLAEEEDEDNELDDAAIEQNDYDDVDEDADDVDQEPIHSYGGAETQLADDELPRHEDEQDIDNDYLRQEAVLEFLNQPPELDEGSPEEQAAFSHELEQFFAYRRMDYRPPKFYRENLNLLKLWRTVIRLGAYDYVTANKLWRQVGETFKPPKKCTTVSWSFRGFYEKSLLVYERYMLHGTMYSSSQQHHGHLDTAEGASSGGQNGLSQPSGRARRDAAVRAMQGWHSHKILETEDAENANVKERNLQPAGSKEKHAMTGVRKKRNFSTPDRALKAARVANGPRSCTTDEPATRDENGIAGYQSFSSGQRKQSLTKQSQKSNNYYRVNGADVRVADEGPEADWVKINVHKTVDCFEVYALVPGLLQEELRVQCEPGGLLVITGEPEKVNNPWGVTPFKKVMKLPSPIDANSTSAVITLHGQLFVRVPYGESQ